MLENNLLVPPSTCPINSLPIEILGQIFSWGLYADMDDGEDPEEDDDDDDDDEGVHKGDKSSWMDVDLSEGEEDDRSVDENDLKGKPPSEFGAPLPFQVLVSHVCRFWRDVALNMPSLWNTLDFTEGPPFDKSRVWIERSQNLPLIITIDCGSPDTENISENSDVSEFSDSITELEDLETVLDLIVPHVSRWRSIEILVASYEFMDMALERLSRCPAAPQLDVLHLSHHDDADPTEVPQPERKTYLLFHGIAPKLDSVSLWGVHIMWSAPFLSGLVDMELAYHSQDLCPSWEDFAAILRNSPNLIGLNLCMSGPATLPTDLMEENIIELSSLRTLELCFQETRYVSRLMKLLPTPNLRKLALDLSEDDFSPFVIDLVTPSPATKKSLLHGLHHLKIGSLPCDAKLVDRIYGQLINLKSLVLTSSFLDEQFFRKLIPVAGQKSSAVFCPNLETITTTGIDGKEMKELVAARKAIGFPIRSVLMGEDDVVSDSTEKWLKAHLLSFGYFEPSDEETDDDDGELEEDLLMMDIEDVLDVNGEGGLNDVD